MTRDRRFWSLVLMPLLALGTLASVSSTPGGYSLAHRSAALAQAHLIAAARPDIGGAGYWDRTFALRDVGLRYGLNDQWHVEAVTDRWYQIVHTGTAGTGEVQVGSITFGSRDWYPGAMMQPPDGHDHDQILHSDSGGARGADTMFGVDPHNDLHKPNNDTAAMPGARGWGATALYGGSCERGANIKVLKVLDGLSGSNGEESAVDGSLSAILKDSIRNDSLDIVDFSNLTPDNQYFIDDGRVFFNDQRTSAGGTSDDACLWISGQSAPGSGFALSGSFVVSYGFMHDLVISNMHFYVDAQGGDQPLRVANGQNVLLRNNTHWLGNTENFVVGSGCTADLGGNDWYPQLGARMSVSGVLSGESYQTQWGFFGCKGSYSNPDSVRYDSDEIPNVTETIYVDIHQSLFTLATHRSPRGGAVKVRLVENYWYEWTQGAMEPDDFGWMDLIDNIGHDSNHAGTMRDEHRLLQFHWEVGGDKTQATINTACTSTANPTSECWQPVWRKQHGGGVTHPLYPNLEGLQVYLKGNKTETNRWLADDSIQFRIMSKYHGNVDDSLPEIDYDSAGLGSTEYFSGDTVHSGGSLPWDGIMPESVNGLAVNKDTANTESPIPIDSDWTADSVFNMASTQKVGAWWQLNADGTRRVEVDSAEITMLEGAADTASNVHTSNNLDSLPDTYLGHRPPWDSGTNWSDSDSDGLPDAYETEHCGSSTCMDPTADPDGDGRENIMEFHATTDPLTADDPDLGMESTVNGGGGGEGTYGDGRFVYLVPAVVDTHVADGDTAIRRIPDTDSVTVQGICIRIPDPDTSHYYAVTYTSQTQSSVLDSAAAEDSMASLGTDRDIRSDACFGQ